MSRNHTKAARQSERANALPVRDRSLFYMALAFALAAALVALAPSLAGGIF